MNDFHLNQLNKVLNYIDDNLEGNLTLGKIAKIGNYSSFHFHRLFRAYTTETLNDYISRKRIEKIASLLIRNKTLTVAELAYTYGFSSNAALTKTFKKTFEISPSRFRQLSSSQYDKVIKSKNGQKFEKFEEYICHINNLKNWLYMNTNVIVKDIKPIKMAYVSHIGMQGLDQSFYKIINWATRNKLKNEKEFEIIRIYNDSFKITSADKVRMEIGVPIDEARNPELDIQYKQIEPKRCITGSFEINLFEFEKAWSSMFIWMNENGYKPGALKPFEIIKNNYNDHPQNKCIVDLYIPVI
ncbi:MAG TPA: helix-turn-helix domain-containing protein [Niabella sp.]|jgi:AraC family transcriptional regulator|nr:AraC family transcriptional regulator [Chitinophagaceae bacterium]HRO85296.1 helix-turn-helix domain-containing protein [Niabella sp.]HUN04792.1 helix-turn-helix domain-containing protein [Niabella sp.]